MREGKRLSKIEPLRSNDLFVLEKGSQVLAKYQSMGHYRSVVEGVKKPSPLEVTHHCT